MKAYGQMRPAAADRFAALWICPVFSSGCSFCIAKVNWLHHATKMPSSARDDEGFAMATFQKGNLTSYYEDAGSGAPLVLICGIGAEVQVWDAGAAARQ